MSDLTKWPRLLVAGQPVTEHQANEILIRTNPRYLQVNDQSWNHTVGRLMGFRVDGHGFPDYASLDEMCERLGMLHLNYLENSRIASSWIGGPHGWCDWDGRIGCGSHNIGKWPSMEEVTADWNVIARTFPYLDLTAQLITNEGEGEIAAEWRVKDGAAVEREPGRQVRIVAEPSMLAFLRDGGERGVSAERLEVAVAQVIETLTAPPALPAAAR